MLRMILNAFRTHGIFVFLHIAVAFNVSKQNRCQAVFLVLIFWRDRP